MCSRCFNTQNQCPLIPLTPLFQSPDQNQQSNKQTLLSWVSILFTWKSHIGTARNFFCVISLVKLLVYWKQICWWKVAYTCSVLRNQYYLCINCIINQNKKLPSQTESILYKTNVRFKRIKKVAEVSLSEHRRKWEIHFAFSVTFLCVNFTAIKKECFNKNLFLKISQHSPENTCVVSFFIKFQVVSLQDSNTGVFLWIIWNF